MDTERKWKTFSVSERHHHNGIDWYKLLVDGEYWMANPWEFGCIKEGIHPEELGMFPFDSDEKG